ncbi:MAG: NAD(P)/FAD-dependent oxidoreductase [bacterium]
MSPTTHEFDAIVLGAGPAGTTAAAVLAQHGRRVAILEKAKFPRYHIGESLIPYGWFGLERLGLVDRLDAASFQVRKLSVQFVSMDGKASVPFYFFKHTEHDCARTWQVLRSEFDQLLLDNAVAKGAVLFEETQARKLVAEGDAVVGVEASAATGTLAFRAPMTIDATGRDAFAAHRYGWRVPDPQLKKLAIWTYYRGAKRDAGVDEGATTVAYVPNKGWFWYIPLADDVISVGVVAEPDYLYRDGKSDPDAIFAREVEIQRWIQDHVASGEKVAPCRVTGDYSYRSRHCASNGLVLVGDAFGFLDPVFSSGVFLALHTGVMAADAVHEALLAGDVSATRFESYGERARRAIEAMRRLVYAFYDEGFSFGAFLKAHPEFRADITDCLIGNVHKDLDPLFAAVAKFAKVPEPLEHGRPFVASPA